MMRQWAMYLITLVLLFFLYGCSQDGMGESGDTSLDSHGEMASPGTADADNQQQQQAGTLTAGDIDDNINYDHAQTYFRDIGQSQQSSALPAPGIQSRVTVRVHDSLGRAVANARITIYTGQTSSVVDSGVAATDGIYYFFPYLRESAPSVSLRIVSEVPVSGYATAEAALQLDALPEDMTVTLVHGDFQSDLPSSLDLMFVIDATGSMSDELEYLKTELNGIINTTREQYFDIAMNFGLTVYRDTGDEYVVREFPFTSDKNLFLQQLSAQSANGGGDYPEAMDAAIAAAVAQQWRGGNVVRLLFLLADAPPHEENIENYVSAVLEAKEQGIQVFPVASSGVDDATEYLLRLASLYTKGRYLFLTDDSGIGNEHKEPTIPCYLVTRLNDLITRIIASELIGQRVEPDATSILRTSGNYDQGKCQ